MTTPFRDGLDWLFFDLGETLFDETGALRVRARQVCRLLEGMGISASGQQVLEAISDAAAGFSKMPIHDAVVALCGTQLTVEEVRAAAPYDPSKETVRDGAADVLAVLAERYRLGVIANQTAGAADRLRQRGLAGFFEVCLTSAEVGHAKPTPEIFHLALAEAGCSPAAAAMIGDRLDNDIRPANRLGMTTIRLRQGYAARQRPRDAFDRPDLTVHDLPALLRYL